MSTKHKHQICEEMKDDARVAEYAKVCPADSKKMFCEAIKKIDYLEAENAKLRGRQPICPFIDSDCYCIVGQDTCPGAADKYKDCKEYIAQSMEPDEFRYDLELKGK